MKLQPNFSFQEYPNEENDDAFRYQMQDEHTLIANAVNATIDDTSFFTRERQTAFTWVDGSEIYTKTFTGITLASGANTVPLAISGKGINQVVRVYGIAQDAVPLGVAALPLPYVDVTAAANQVSLSVTPTNVVITVGSGSPAIGYVAYVTVEYTKL